MSFDGKVVAAQIREIAVARKAVEETKRKNHYQSLLQFMLVDAAKQPTYVLQGEFDNEWYRERLRDDGFTLVTTPSLWAVKLE